MLSTKIESFAISKRKIKLEIAVYEKLSANLSDLSIKSSVLIMSSYLIFIRII